MTCPWLQETRVRYCEKSAFRKMIRVDGRVTEETCATPRYRQCRVYQQFADGSQDAQCPYLRESRAQYCGAAAAPRLIPYSDPMAGRCGNSAYRYCAAYLGAADAAAVRQRDDHAVDGIRMPRRLYYSANHMWLDTEGGTCHIGLDGFLTRVLGSVEHITFLRQTGAERPIVVITVRGVDLELIFPNPIRLAAANAYLRVNPEKLTADPYGVGWLFEGASLPGQAPATLGLMHGQAARAWVDGEIGRMSAFLADCWFARRGTQVMHDGGIFCAGVVAQLSREETVRLFHEFFCGWKA